jgi:outer membrane lipoprotein
MSVLTWPSVMASAVALSMATIGCAKSAHQTGQNIFDKVLPPELRSQADPNLRFADLRASPEQYGGKVVMLSGIVLGAKRKQDYTEIEVLQLPSEPGEPPTMNRSSSEGRFLVIKEGLDPATVEVGHPIAVIGQVKGKAVKMLDETEYTYPVLEAVHLVDWQKMQPRYGGYGGYPYPYGYYGRGFGYPYGYYGYGYPYYGPYGYAPFGFRGGGPALPPAPQSVPPRFRRDDD